MRKMLLLSIFLACGDADESATIQSNTTQTTADAQTDSTPKSAPASTTDCDATLKDYSQMVDQYIALMDKASKGDASAMQEYPALMKKVESNAQNLQGLQKDGKIDANCWKKYNAITARMSRASMKMSGASAEDQQVVQEMNTAVDKAVDQAACMQACQSNADPMAQATCIQECM